MCAARVDEKPVINRRGGERKRKRKKISGICSGEQVAKNPTPAQKNSRKKMRSPPPHAFSSPVRLEW